MANTVKSTKSTKGDMLSKTSGNKKNLQLNTAQPKVPRGDAGYWKRVANQ